MDYLPLTYDKMTEKVFASGVVPDGYFGDTLKVEFALIGARIFLVHEHGYCTTDLPDVEDVKEASWILEHHPRSRAKQVERLPFDVPTAVKWIKENVTPYTSYLITKE